jgi:hypothetical protein
MASNNAFAVICEVAGRSRRALLMASSDWISLTCNDTRTLCGGWNGIVVKFWVSFTRPFTYVQRDKVILPCLEWHCTRAIDQ